MSVELTKNNVVIDEKRLNGWTIEHENVFIEWSDKGCVADGYIVNPIKIIVLEMHGSQYLLL